MNTYLRNKSAWLQLFIFGCLTMGILVIVLMVGSNLVAVANHLSVKQILSMTPADYARPELSGVIKGMLIVQFFGIFLLPSLVFAYLADPRPLAFAGLKEPQKNSFLFIAVITMVIGYFTVEFLGTINEALVHILPASAQKWVENGEADANGTLGNLLNMKGPEDLVVCIFLIGVLPAIGEELFFRGILQKFFIQIFKKALPGIIFTGFLFSAIHMQFMGFLPRMALGIILGALYWYSGSLYTSMLGHFVFNTINILLIYFKVADLDSKTSGSLAFGLLGIASLILVVYLLNRMKKNSTTSYDKEFPPIREITIFDEPDHPV
jgi:uncharacterized protein